MKRHLITVTCNKAARQITRTGCRISRLFRARLTRWVMLPAVLLPFTLTSVSGSLSMIPYEAPILTLVTQPLPAGSNNRDVFAPLAAYLSKMTGYEVVLKTLPNELAYWSFIRKGEGYDLVIDSAHFTDYRQQKLGDHVLAKLANTVSYTLVVSEYSDITDPAVLVGKRIGCVGKTGNGAGRLTSLFPNPLRQPVIVSGNSADEIFDLLADGEVQAAILPTTVVAERFSSHRDISAVLTTEPVPHLALSASTRVKPMLRKRILDSMLRAHLNDDVRYTLAQLKQARFEPAHPAEFEGHMTALASQWGY